MGVATTPSPTPQALAAAPLERIRDCGVGYRDRYLKQLAQSVIDGFDLEAIKLLPREEARRELMTLPGVGPYTADLGLIIGADAVTGCRSISTSGKRCASSIWTARRSRTTTYEPSRPRAGATTRVTPGSTSRRTRSSGRVRRVGASG